MRRGVRKPYKVDTRLDELRDFMELVFAGADFSIISKNGVRHVVMNKNVKLLNIGNISRFLRKKKPLPVWED